MKFSAIFLTFGLVAAATAATTSSSAADAYPTSSYTPAQQECTKNCGTNLNCVAECFGNPGPTEDMANATTKCAAGCIQGSGSQADTEKYAACQQKCIADFFFNNSAATTTSGLKTATTAGGSKPSGTSGSSSGSDSGSDSGSGSESTPSSSGSAAAASSTGKSGSGRIAISGAAVVLAAAALAL